MPIEAVIFDMDGVLVDSYQPHLESWRMLAEENGLAITEAQFAETFGRTSRDIIGRLFGVTDAARVAALDERKEALYRDAVRGNVPEMAGAKALVAALHACGIKLAIGSSGPCENIVLVRDELGLAEMMPTYVCGADVEHGKPAPDVFLLAVEKLGVAPANCAVIEDAPAGIAAANAAGMLSIALTSTHDAAGLKDADVVVDALADVESALGYRSDSSE